MWWECLHGSGRSKENPRSAAARAAGLGGPGKRWGHTCNAVRGGKLLYVFGGYGCDNSQTNDVHVFDTVKKTWSKPVVKGTPPSPRDSHSCTTVGNRLFVFGGTDGTNPLKDLHILDTSSNTWILPAVSGEGPEAREGHSATLVDKRLFIFGGCGKSIDTQQELYFNDLYILDTENLVWIRAMTFGTPPSPRDSHTCSTWNKNIIVLGGEDPSDCYLADVYMLDAETLVWKQVNTSGQMLAPRAGHTTVVLGSNLFVFGGFTDSRNLYDDLHVLNVATSTWSRVVTVNRGPSARFSVAGDCLDERRGIIVFIGGCNNHLEALDDMYFLHASMPGENGLAEPITDKFSSSVLKKCKNILPTKEPEKNNNVHMIGLTSEPSHPTYLQTQSQTGVIPSTSQSTVEVTFDARVVDENQFGYTIETVINGKLLRGMLICSAASSNQDGHTYPNKRRLGTDSESQPVPAVRITSQETRSSEQKLIAATSAMEPASETSPMQIVTTGLTNATANSGLYQSNMASEYVEPASLPSRDLRDQSDNKEPPKIQYDNMIVASENLSIPPAQDSMTERLDEESLSLSSEHLNIDSEKLEPSPMLSKDMKNGSQNLATTSGVVHDGTSNQPHEASAVNPSENPVTERTPPPSHAEDQ